VDHAKASALKDHRNRANAAIEHLKASILERRNEHAALPKTRNATHKARAKQLAFEIAMARAIIHSHGIDHPEDDDAPIL
jgi:hypothetical protein